MTESIFPKAKPGTERALVAFDAEGNVQLWTVKGPYCEGEIETIGHQEAAESIGYIDGQTSCMRVVDLRPVWTESYSEGYPTGDGEVDFSHASFRHPTEYEWDFIQDGDMASLRTLWADILSADEARKGEAEAAKQPAEKVSLATMADLVMMVAKKES